MKLDIRNDKIDPESEFGKAFDRSAYRAYQEVFEGKKYWHGEKDHFKKMRKIIDRDMMDYLLAHEGVVDGWPEPNTDLYVITSGTFRGEKQTETYYFHYFGNEAGALQRMNEDMRGIKYRDEYEYEFTPLYKKTIADGEYVGVTPSENRGEILKYWLVRMPMVWGAIAAVVAVLGFIGLDL